MGLIFAAVTALRNHTVLVQEAVTAKENGSGQVRQPLPSELHARAARENSIATSLSSPG
jgi:hypothetical protein